MPPLVRTNQIVVQIGTESSVYDLHPIRDGASSRPRGVALLLSLGLTPLLILGLSISLKSPFLKRHGSGPREQAQKSVTLLLHEPDRPGVRAPVRNLRGPKVAGGKGHREGTGTLDSRLIAYTTILSKPSDAIDPGDLSASLRAERVYLSLNPALPLHPGGDGLATGTRRDSAQGPGGLLGYGSYDFRLIPTRQVRARHTLAFGEDREAREPVRVLIQLGNDGVPFRARVVSGPAFLYQEALTAAMQWRFEPLAPHGLKAPVSAVLTFDPDFLD